LDSLLQVALLGFRDVKIVDTASRLVDDEYLLILLLLRMRMLDLLRLEEQIVRVEIKVVLGRLAHSDSHGRTVTADVASAVDCLTYQRELGLDVTNNNRKNNACVDTNPDLKLTTALKE